MNKAKRYSPEARERAVRLLFEHEKDYRSRWAAVGCGGADRRVPIWSHFP